MTHIQTADSAAPAKSLPARFAGILFAPRATYAAVAAHPRWLGMFLTVFVITASAATALMSTEIGRNALLDQQIASQESFGRKMTQDQIDRLEKISAYYAYGAPVIQFVSLAVGGLVVAGIAFAVFNAMLGGDAAFRQVFAVATHSGVVLAAMSLFTTPLAYARESLSGATNLAALLPFLDESSFVARLLGSIDLILIWWLVSLAIGLGVLYRRRTAPIATALFAAYAAIAVVIAAVKTASTGV
ncbi:MAG: Yip1 domain protein [Acidobacteria bacterium]|nr:Yip1 domain protein [Acidobacteriota bacterium]